MKRIKRNIKKVAIYLRKSRDEEKIKDVLKKHRDQLVKHANQNGWKYKIYEEIGSGDSIDERPEFQRLLDDVYTSIYDAVLVIHYDRLSRGGTRDFGRVIEDFTWGRTYIATPDKIYDVNDPNDLTLLGMQSVLSNHEYQRTIERYQAGKHAGARQGKWTNGKPPYPYFTKRDVITDDYGRKVVSATTAVNSEHNEVYQRIKQEYLTGSIGTEKIAFQLNEDGIPSPGGKKWSSNSVQRLLVHEFHMGIHKYGQYTWEKNRRRFTRNENEPKYRVEKNDDEHVSRGRGSHPVLKTEQDHKRILEILERNNRVPKRSRVGTFPTSGLLYCKKCGYQMGYSIGRVEKKTGKQYHLTKCTHKSHVGVKCSQRGIKMTENFYEALYDSVINRHLDSAYIQEKIRSDEAVESINRRICILQKDLAGQTVKLNRVMDAYEEGLYSAKQFKDRKTGIEEAIVRIESEIDELSEDKVKNDVIDEEMLKEKIKDFRRLWSDSLSNKEKNQLLRTLVKKIYYDREDDQVTFEIEYL